jgi:S1-C subfamily serine protease
MRKLRIVLFFIGLAFLISGIHLLEHSSKVRTALPPYRGSVPTLSPKQLDIAKHQTVLLSMEGVGEVGRCTGVVISPTHIVTAHHCMEDAAFANVLVYTYPIATVYHAKPIFGDEQHDLVLVETDKPIKLNTYAKFSPLFPDGSSVTSIGNALGSMTWYVTHGIVGEHFKFFLLSDVLIMPGNSGGPWFNLNGDVVGISDFTISSHEADRGMAGAIDGATVIKFLQDYNNSKKLQSILQQLFGGN